MNGFCRRNSCVTQKMLCRLICFVRIGKENRKRRHCISRFIKSKMYHNLNTNENHFFLIFACKSRVNNHYYKGSKQGEIFSMYNNVTLQ